MGRQISISALQIIPPLELVKARVYLEIGLKGIGYVAEYLRKGVVNHYMRSG